MLNIWGRATLQEGHLITTKPKTITMILLEKLDALVDRHDPAVAAITGIHAIRSYKKRSYKNRAVARSENLRGT